MNYKGKLYGRLAGKYFETGKTSEDWDALKAGAKWLRDEILSHKCPVCGKPETAGYSPCCSMGCWTQQFEEPKPINQ